MSLETCHSPNITSYKIVGDNLDKRVQPRYTGVNKYQSYFPLLCCSRQVDTSRMTDVSAQLCLPSPDILVKSLLPSKADDDTIRQNFKILISRVLIQHIKFFEISFKDIVQCHIPHVYDKEMSKKSKVVRC